MKRILLALVALACIGGGVAYYLWNKPHQNMNTAKTDVTIDAMALFTEYNADEAACNAKYLDKVIAVSGKVKEVANDEGTVKVSLDTNSDFGVRCELSTTTTHARTTFTPGEQVTFKGTCSGLNFDVQLNNCVEVR
jgi:tRNA_anti-like